MGEHTNRAAPEKPPHRFDVEVTRQWGRWTVEVEDPGVVTEVSRLGDVELHIPRLIAGRTGLDPDRVEVNVVHILVDGIDAQSEAERVRLARRVADDAAEHATALTRTLVQRLRAQGVTIRDAGAIIGLAPQRISAIEHAAAAAESADPR